MDQAGRVQNIAAFGDAQTAERTHDISMTFQYGHFDDQLIIELLGGGALDNDKAMLRATATNAGDLVHVTTREAILYQSGYDAQCMFTAAFTSYEGSAVVEQHIGAYDDDDGYVIGADHGHLLIKRFKGGVEVDVIDQHDFNLDQVDGTGVSGFKVDITKLNIYRIQYGYLGILPAIFEIFGGSQLGWIPLHVIDVVNVEIDTIIENPYLPIRLHSKVVSGNPGIPIEVRTGSWFGGTIGGERNIGDFAYFAAKNNLAYPVGGLPVPIMAIRNKTLFRGKNNRLRVDFTFFSFASDGNKSVNFDAYVNPVLTGEVFTDIDTQNSVIETAVNTFTFTGGRYLGSLLLNKVGSDFIIFSPSEVRISPGDMLVLVAQSDSSSDLRFSARWGEAR